MALKPTIHKARVALSDLNRDYYDALNLTIARHPSETIERMMARILAFCLNAEAGLTFTKGLSTPDEPDIIALAADDSVSLWIDVGEPAADRIKKATRIAGQVKVYSFNAKSNIWWEKNKTAFEALTVSIYQLPWAQVHALAHLAERTMDYSVTLSEQSVYISSQQGDCEITCSTLHAPNR